MGLSKEVIEDMMKNDNEGTEQVISHPDLDDMPIYPRDCDEFEEN